MNTLERVPQGCQFSGKSLNSGHTMAIHFQAICLIFLCTNWIILDSFHQARCHGGGGGGGGAGFRFFFFFFFFSPPLFFSFFFSCQLSGRSLSMVIIPLPHYDNLWKQILKSEKKCVGALKNIYKLKKTNWHWKKKVMMKVPVWNSEGWRSWDEDKIIDTEGKAILKLIRDKMKAFELPIKKVSSVPTD